MNVLMIVISAIVLFAILATPIYRWEVKKDTGQDMAWCWVFARCLGIASMLVFIPWCILIAVYMLCIFYAKL